MLGAYALSSKERQLTWGALRCPRHAALRTSFCLDTGRLRGPSKELVTELLVLVQVITQSFRNLRANRNQLFLLPRTVTSCVALSSNIRQQLQKVTARHIRRDATCKIRVLLT